MQWMVRVARSQTAGMPFSRAVPQRVQVPSYLTRHEFSMAETIRDLARRGGWDLLRLACRVATGPARSHA